MSELRNLVCQVQLRERLAADTRPRRTLSFYRYSSIEAPQELRAELFEQLTKLEVLGRVYLAYEGINAQISVPADRLDSLRNYLDSIDFLRDIRLNIAIEEGRLSFWVLKVKVRPKIVADGIDDPNFSMQRTGRLVDAAEFNELADRADTVIVDMRNYYEYEVGHFENAVEISSDTFREQLPMAVEKLQENKDKTIVMYCTGGIRCEKASAYLRHHGFPNVCHLEGGIIEYARRVQQDGLANKFRGKNFVFDDRLGERIGGEIISQCHQCGAPADTHRNCANNDCHLLFIQCEACRTENDGCCSDECRSVVRSLVKYASEPAGSFNNSRHRMRARFFDLHRK